MRIAFGLLLLLTQLEPLGGAAMCLLVAPAQHEACAPDPARGGSMLQAEDGSGVGANCRVVLCAPAAPAVLAAPDLVLSQLAPMHPPAPSWVPLLHPIDPASPPLPPPIA